ncbi:MAG: Fused isobutyryl-CoA mutase [Chloroflexi bacterium]|nr:Fused isobutyryl-CoA mutase [Chloroflexota bacterium]
MGVNTFLGKDHGGEITTTIELIRSTEDEKSQQISNMRAYQAARNGDAADGLKPLQHTARKRENLFAALVEAVKTHSLGQISHALYEVGGEYRRNM